MKIQYFKDKTIFHNFLLENKNNKKIQIFYDIETLQYNESNGRIKPTDYKNIMYSFAISFYYENNLETVSFFNFVEFTNFIYETCKNKTNEKISFGGNIYLIAQNNNKYDNHFLLVESIKYLDNNIKRKNMYLRNSKKHIYEDKKSSITKKDKFDGIFLEKRVKSSNNLEFEFTYRNIHFITQDFIMKTNTNLATLGEKLFRHGLITKEQQKESYEYTKYNRDIDMTDNEALEYARKVYDNLSVDEFIYIENDVIILGYGYINYEVIYEGFSIDKLTLSSNILESYKINDLSSFQLINETEDDRIDYTKYNFNNKNFYDYLKEFYKGGLNLYNDKYLSKIINEEMFSIDLNSSYSEAMYNEKIPTFLKEYDSFEKSTSININYDEHFYLYTIEKNIFNYQVLQKIESKIIRQILVKYYATKNDYISINSNTFKMINDICKVKIKELDVLSYLKYECVYFGAREKIKDFYFIKTQGKIKNKIIMNSPYDIIITDEINDVLLSPAEIDLSKVNLNGIYGIPALRPYFNTFYLMDDGDYFNEHNNFVNSKRNILFSIFVTSVALKNLLYPLSYLTSKEIDNDFVYCDTDSLYLLKTIFDKFPNNLFDKYKLGKWDIENNQISKFFVLNHKKYAYYSNDMVWDKKLNGYREKGLQIRTGGIRKTSFNLDMDFEKFIFTQFSDGCVIKNTKSILNKQGTVSIYESDTNLKEGNFYPSYFSEYITKMYDETLEHLKIKLENGLENDLLYIETPFGTFSERQLFEIPEEKNTLYDLGTMVYVHEQIKNNIID